MVQHLRQKQGARILLSPNRSLSWQGNIRVWLGLCLVSLIIAAGMAWAGAWVVLPFAGLELISLAAGIYYTSRQCQRQEVLDISPEHLQLKKRLYRRQMGWTMPRRAVRIHLIASSHPWTPPRLFLLYRELEISLACFLNMDDTRALISLLENLGITVERKAPYREFRF